MATNEPEDLPPSYMSQNNQTSTLTDRPNPALSAILKPNHSTRASGLSYATSQGRYSILEYHALTFAVMFSHHSIKKVMVIAVDEELDTLIKDVQRMYGSSYFVLISQLRVDFAYGLGNGKSVGNGERLSEENITAYLRFIKSRNGVDMISAK